LQRVNPLFDAAVQEDIVGITAHLRAQNIQTISLIPTRDSAPYLQHQGYVWRKMHFIHGTNFERITRAAQAFEAGRVLAEFDRGVSTYPRPLHNRRPNVHVLSRHLAALDAARSAHAVHRDFEAIEHLADAVWAEAAKLHDFPAGPERLVHGDPKISNILFNDDTAICLIDLDTLTMMPLVYELADALRSWCNTADEDSPDASFSLEFCSAACEGFASNADAPNPTLARSLASATYAIAIELAARFCTDAFNENYFGWDSKRFGSASEHNRARCQSQLNLARDIFAQRDKMLAITARAFA
jgi:Ser/Thr protein kinase RdoA (MazF antagonist)